MPETPLTAIGDEAIEARIVAWVLGEASAFEIAELERLCGERPELAIFHRRMAALHGLIGEANQSGTEEAWKLSPEKRKAVQQILGEEPIRLEVAKETRVRHSARRAILAIAACVVLTVVILQMMPRQHTSQAVIEIRPRLAPMSPLGPAMSDKNGRMMTEQFFGTEFEKIKSRNSLEKVVDKLELAERWGTDKGHAIDQLKDRVETKNIRGTDLIEIEVKHRDKSTADEIAREVAYAYKDYREQIEQKDADQQLAELNKSVRDQEDKVEERRKVVDSIARSKPVSSKGELAANDSGERSIREGLDHQDLADAKREYETEAGLLNTMKTKLMGETISRQIPSSSVEIHELPGGQTQSKSSMALASKEPMKSLRTEIPSERIEGTPKPMVLPEQTPSREMAARFAQADSSAALDAMVVVQEKEKKVQASPERKPSEPSASMTKVIVSGTASDASIPVPEVDVATPSLTFGDGDAFGTGWGGAGGAGGGPINQIVKSGETSAGIDLYGNREVGSFSGLADVRQGGLKKDLSTLKEGEATADAYWDTNQAEGQKIHGEIHAGYTSEYLFRGMNLGANEQPASEVTQGPVPENTRRRNLSADKAPIEPLADTDQAREMAVPPADPQAFEGFINDGSPISGRDTSSYAWWTGDESKKSESPSNLAQREMIRRQNSVTEAERLFTDAKSSQSNSDLQAAYDNYEKSLSLLPDVPANPSLTERRDIVQKSLSEVATPLEEQKQQAEIEVIREFEHPSEFEPPESPEALTKAIREQEDKVEERRKVLATMVRTKGIVYKWNDSSQDKGAGSAVNMYHTLEQQKAQLESQISSLDKYGSDQQMVYASGLDLPDNNVRQLYPQYQQAKRQLESYRVNGLSDNHPTVKDAQSQLDLMKRQLDESVVTLRATLKAQSDLVTDRLKSVEIMKDESREKLVRDDLDTQDYEAAKKEFEREQALLQAMKGKISKLKEPEPKPDLTKLIEEIAAAEEPYSTFSLNISDASFRIAQAAMAKGERPDPAGVKVEQFYNAVNYGDPSPRAGEPVACFIEQSAHPVIPGRNLVRVALKTAAAGRSAAQPLRLTLLVDQSGSMSRADRRAAMDTAMRSLGTLLTDKDLVTVIGFSRTSRLLADGMKGDEVSGKLAGLVNQSASEGGTNLEEAIKLAEQKAMGQKLVGAQNRIVLFTDGAANLGDADPERLAAKVEQLRQQGIAFDIAGIAADDLNDELLAELARKGNGRYSVVGKGEEQDFAKQLAGAFRPAAENVKVQVRFNPERVARYKLIGFEKDRLKTEDFRNDAVDAAELAAEEAGVAIYQVEPLPDGRGEIGEVSVRFRDTSSGEMVERMWTMAHDPATPGVDSAVPSMQLAVLAMLAGEKLKGGPLADAIDFKQFAEPQATVKQAFGRDTRVGEMLRMLDALK